MRSTQSPTEISKDTMELLYHDREEHKEGRIFTYNRLNTYLTFNIYLSFHQKLSHS